MFNQYKLAKREKEYIIKELRKYNVGDRLSIVRTFYDDYTGTQKPENEFICVIKEIRQPSIGLYKMTPVCNPGQLILSGVSGNCTVIGQCGAIDIPYTTTITIHYSYYSKNPVISNMFHGNHNAPIKISA